MWRYNGRPHKGIFADLQGKTRGKYYHVGKMVIKCDRLTKASVNIDIKAPEKCPNLLHLNTYYVFSKVNEFLILIETKG